jgi:copine 5/8/9
VSDCFPLSLQNDQLEVDGLDGLLKSYKEALRGVTLSGPSKLSSIIKTTMKTASEPVTAKNQYYIILLILTDGEIEDMKESIDAIIEASKLPMSIIIVGIGDGNFANMHKLDSDDKKLTSGKKTAIRDIVQFVRFESFSGDGEKLAAATLQEIPKQFLTFMKIKGMKPIQNEAAQTRIVSL